MFSLDGAVVSIFTTKRDETATIKQTKIYGLLPVGHTLNKRFTHGNKFSRGILPRNEITTHIFFYSWRYPKKNVDNDWPLLLTFIYSYIIERIYYS